MKFVFHCLVRLLQETGYLLLWLAAVPFAVNYLYFFPVVALSMLAVILLHIARWIFIAKNRREPALHPLLLWAPAALLLPLWGLLLCGEVRIVNPAYPWIVLSTGAAALLLYAAPKAPTALKTAACAPVFLLWAVNFPFVLVAILITAIAGVFVVAVLLPGKRVYKLPAWVVASAVMSLATGIITLRFYFSNGDIEPEIIAGQPGVQTLFTLGENSELAEKLGQQIMFVMEGCNSNNIFIGSQGLRHGGLVRMNTETGRVEASSRVGQSSDNMILNCDRNSIVIGDFSSNSAIRFLSTANLSRTTSRPIPVEFKATRIAAAKDRSHYYALNENHHFFVYSGAARKVLADFSGPDEWIYFKNEDRFVAFTEPGFDMISFSYKESSGNGEIEVNRTHKLDIPVYERLNLFIHEGAEPGTVLVSNMWDGTLTELDSDFNETRSLRVAPGARNIEVTPDGETIIVAGYADGFIYFINSETFEVAARRFIGRRIRGLNFSSNGKYLYAGSAQGGFRLDIPEVLEEAESPYVKAK